MAETGLLHPDARVELLNGEIIDMSPIGPFHGSITKYLNRFFNAAAFVPANLVPRGTYGNSGRNIISGPAFSNSDVTLMKDIILREPLRLQLRGEFFNVLNQVNFSPPNTLVSAGGFGRITGAEAGRVIQLAMKVLW